MLPYRSTHRSNRSKLSNHLDHYFKTYLTEVELVDRVLSYSVELTQGYTLYQEFLYAIHKQTQTYFDTLEYLNNHIKVLKRNAYGFRNFYNFKLRILVQQEQAIQTK